MGIWIILGITLLLLFLWLFLQPKQGAKASNALQSKRPDALPTGDVRAVDDGEAEKATQVKAGLSAPPLSLEDEIHHLLSVGQKIAAIKRVREVKHWGLKEAKDYVEALALNESPSLQVTTSEPKSALRDEVRRLLAAHQKVSAVKLVREETHWHLRDAKQYVDAVQRDENKALESTLSMALPDQALRDEVKRLVADQRIQAAVQRVKAGTGWNLSRSIDYVNQVHRLLKS